MQASSEIQKWREVAHKAQTFTITLLMRKCLQNCVILRVQLAIPRRCFLMSQTPTLTFAFLKPDAFQTGHAEAILNTIKANGFSIVEQSQVVVSRDRWHLFWKTAEKSPQFSELLDFCASGPVILVVLSKVDAVSEMLRLVGPEGLECTS